MISSDRSDNPQKLLMIIPMTSSESCDDIQRHWWYPQKTVAICAENIGSVFWGTNIFTGLCSWCVKSSKFSADHHPQNFLRILILRIFWGSSGFSEDRHRPNFLRIVILRISWGSSSLEFSEDPHPQNFLRVLIFRIFKRSSSSGFYEDPQDFHSISVFMFEHKRFFWHIFI